MVYPNCLLVEPERADGGPRIGFGYDLDIATGPLQGLNNKLKDTKRSAEGYRAPVFFCLRIQC